MGSKPSKNGGSVVGQQILKETRKLTWIIADFAELKHYSKDMLKAILLEVPLGRKIRFPVTIKAYLDLQENDGKNCLHLYFRAVGPLPQGATEVKAMVHLKIGSYWTATYDTLYNLRGQAWGWSLCPLEKEHLSKFPVNLQGGLPVDIEVTVYNTLNTVKVPLAPALPDLMTKFQERFLQKLSEDMAKFQNASPGEGLHAGVVKLISQDGKEVTVESSILMARSPVFRTMFQTPMTEMKEGVVKMEDFGREALEVFLHFLCTATLKDNWKEPGILEEVMSAAHKYLMQDLLDFLDEVLGEVSTPENVGKLLKLACRLELKKAEKALLEKFREQINEAEGAEQVVKLCENLAYDHA